MDFKPIVSAALLIPNRETPSLLKAVVSRIYFKSKLRPKHLATIARHVGPQSFASRCRMNVIFFINFEYELFKINPFV